MKITIIGAGSTYTPELIEGLIHKRKTLPLTELYLMDIDPEKLNIVGNLAIRMLEHNQMNCKTVLTTDISEAVKDSTFILTQIRVGRLDARIKDEKIPLKYDLIGQETCGIGGFFKALRTIPVIFDYCKIIEKLAPNAFLINFTNPAGILTEMILNHTKVKAIGLCNVPINTIDGIKKKLGLRENSYVEYLGLNHFTFVTKVLQDGKDYLKDAINMGLNSEAMKNIPTSGFTKEAIEIFNAIPSSYLEYYFFKDQKLEKLKLAEKTRGEICKELEKDLLESYKNVDLYEKPESLSKRGGSRYSEAAINLINALYNDTNEVMVVNTKNLGALDFLEENDVIEINCTITKDGAIPIKPMDFKNSFLEKEIYNLKQYEKFTVEAALKSDSKVAIQALMLNPLVIDYNKAHDCFNEMKEAHKDYLKGFFKNE